MAGKAPAALAAAAGATDGQNSLSGAQEEPMAPHDDGKPPAAMEEEPKASDKEQRSHQMAPGIRSTIWQTSTLMILAARSSWECVN